MSKSDDLKCDKVSKCESDDETSKSDDLKVCRILKV